MYEKHTNLWKRPPSKILLFALSKMSAVGNFLDLGCGQGKDSIFMSKGGFNTIAVDLSKVAINRLNQIITKNRLSNISTFAVDIMDFPINTATYDIIACIDTMPFLEKNTSLKMIEKIKDGLRKDGLAILTAFTISDPSYNLPKNKRLFKTYFRPNEILALFCGFDIIHYFEGFVQFEKAIKKENRCHGVVRIIARK